MVPFPREDVTLRAVAIAPDGRVAVSGSKGTLGLSDDGGRTWRLVAVPGAEALDLRGVAAPAARALVVMSAGDAAAGQAKLFHSGDGGASWTLAYETRAAGGFFDTVRFWSPRRGMVMGDAVDGAWFLAGTRDGGRSWTRLEAAMPAPLAGEAAFAASNSALFLGDGGRAWIASGGASAGRVFRSHDAGMTWRVSDAAIVGGPTGGVFGGLSLGGGRVVVVGGDHKDETRGGTDIALSQDGGADWIAAAAAGRLLEAVGRLDASTLIAVGPRGTMVSRDRGWTWAAADTEAFHAIACAHKRCVAVGGKGRVGVWEAAR